MLELSINDIPKLQKVTHALSSEVRLQIISHLSKRNMNVHELAESLKIPVSTSASHIRVLEESGLIITEFRPAIRGAMKVCTRNFDDIHIQLNDKKRYTEDYKNFEMEMPIGQYIDFNVTPTCGMANHDGLLIPEDEPVYFYNPNRSEAQILWTRKGYFEYKFPLVIPPGSSIKMIQFSMEICSEAPNHDPNWPSDITIWVNGIDIGTWTSPGDFGDRPGKLNPNYWRDSTSTQYGLLKTWKIGADKSMIDDVYLSGITVQDLKILENDCLSLKVGIKDDAIRKGGINLFGKEFGDHNQDIKLTVEFF